MATCSDVISVALRKLAITTSGGAPNASQTSDGILSLQAMFDGWVAQGVFGRLNPKQVAINCTAEEQDLVIKTAVLTVTLPSVVTILDQTRVVKDLAMVRVVSTLDTIVTTSIYDALTARWVALGGFTLATECPLSNRGSDGLAACLAMQIASEYGLEAPSAVVMLSARFMRSITNRSFDPVESAAQVYY